MGDSITAYTVDEAITSGGSPSTYDFYIVDATTGQSCSSAGNHDTSIGTPYSASFMAASAGSLPQFGLVNMNASLYSGGALVGAQAYFDSGLSKQYTMTNDGYPNTYTGAPASGSWTDVWQTSPGA